VVVLGGPVRWGSGEAASARQRFITVCGPGRES